ncbi:MAG: double-strand break repair protein AddB [Beijerinckiaceae bacterium]
MASRRAHNVCSIAPGAPFLPNFARALMEGRVVEGFPDKSDAASLSNATIYVPTRRAARALALELARSSERDAIILPRIVPLGVMDGVENDLLFDASTPDSELARVLGEDLPDAVGDMQRRLTLTRLIHAWSKGLRGAIQSIGADGKITASEEEPMLVAVAPAHAFHLAGDLGALIDEMIIEEVDWSKLDALAPENLAKYWGITLDFLKIATKAWPGHLEALRLIDKAARQMALVQRRVAQIEAGAASGVEIVAGSTGANIATAHLMAAIAKSPRGAVVLPGLDKALDDESWSAIAGERSDPASGHPQGAFRRLLPLIGIGREDVRELACAAPDIAARMSLVCEAMRPAETTERWSQWRRDKSDADLEGALGEVAIIEAADEREEALAIAIALREAITVPEATAALITPDRNIARRVRAELQRWDIELDDSGGDPLANSPLGVMARLALDCAHPSCASAPLLALLRHPLVRLGFPAAWIGRLVSDAELGLLRGSQPDLADPITLVRETRDRMRNDAHTHPTIKGLTDSDWNGAGELLARLQAALEPLRKLSETLPRPQIRAWVGAHETAIRALIAQAPGEESGAIEDLAVLLLLLEELSQAQDFEDGLGADDYAVFFETAARETAVRRQRAHHPRIKSLGLLEARLMSADVTVLAGLDETVWPPATKTDSFLSRPMRAELGLSAPERRIGQTAHDFVQAFGAQRVFLTRAKKRAGAPTTPSRFLQRLGALAGKALDARREAGAYYLRMAQALDARSDLKPVARPQPRPPVELRPARLSVTRVETLRRDPYAIYAERILRLKPLDGLDEDETAQGFGTRMHEALAQFQKANPNGPGPGARADLLATAARVFQDLRTDPEFEAFKWPRIEAICDAWLAWESRRRADVASALIEQSAELEFRLADGTPFTLSAAADRIEKRADGSYVVIDYKTGTPPSARMVAVGFAPQLTLEAEMIRLGAFGGAPANALVSDASYVKLGGGEGVQEKGILERNSTKSVAQLGQEHMAGLRALLMQFRDPQFPYSPRPYPQFESRSTTYDHLSRYREWSSGGEGE